MNDAAVLISAPVGRDAELLAKFLTDAGIEAVDVTHSLGSLTIEQRDRAGALLVAEESLTQQGIAQLGVLLSAQPSWSDLPLLLLVSGGRERINDPAKQRERLPLGNVTALERPLRPSSLLSAVEAAIRARKRQFEIRDTTLSLEAAYAELRRGEQQAKLILESTHDCIKLLDLDGSLLTMNVEGQRRLGICNFADVCGKPWVAFWKPGDQDNVRRAIADAMQGHVGSFEGFFETPSGEATWWDVSVTPVRGEAGQIVNLLAVSRETTNRKLTERALIQSEKLAAVGRLVSTISHEINNPLEAVTNLIYIALHADGLPDEARDMLNLADDELRRASHIVSQTLSFNRQSMGAQSTTPEHLIQSVMTLYRARLMNSRIVIEARHAGDVAFVCFEGELRQALSNLIGNAIDAMRGGGRLVVRSHATKGHTAAREGVVITIADTGHGMTPEVSRKVFDAFYSTKGDNGNGLGLWITKGIIDKHKGRLAVRSRPGDGTVFRMYLPAAA